MVQYDASLMRVRIRVCIPADVQGIQACVSGDRDNVFEAYQIRVDADQHKLTVWASSGPGQPIRELASFRYWAAYEFLDADGHVMGRARDLQTAEA